MSGVAKTFGATLHGVEATIVTIEVNVADGMRFHVSGLPDKAIKESEHRIESSIKESGIAMCTARSFILTTITLLVIFG